MDNSYIFTFVRHGQTDFNKRDIFIGITDEPLNELGFQQAEKTGKYFASKRMKFDLGLTSPLLRCTQTASVLKKFIPIEFNTENELKERNYGIFEGKTHEYIKLNHLDLFNKYLKEKPFIQLPEGESALDLEKRIKHLFWDKISQNYPSSTSILVITHLNPIRAMLRLCGLVDWNIYFRKFQNSSITQIETNFKESKLLLLDHFE